MEILNSIINFGILLALIIGYFLLKNLLPNYFAEKGKNLATKEDIEEITKKIKTVESKINVKENGEIDYYTLKSKTILEYFGAYNNWENLVTDGTSKTGPDSKSKNEIAIEQISQSKLKYNLKEGEIEIFIADKTFYELRKEVVINLLKLQQEFEKHCSNIDYIESFETDIKIKHQKILDEKQDYHKILILKLTELMTFRNNLIAYLESKLKESFS